MTFRLRDQAVNRFLRLLPIPVAWIAVVAFSAPVVEAAPDHGLASSVNSLVRPGATTPVRTILWADEFDIPGPPNPEYWSHEVNCAGGGNNERQCYTDRLENSYVDEDGFLHIVAREETFSGPSLQDDHPDYPGPSVTRNYTSARLRTKHNVDWKYGRIEVRAKLPGGQGMWPAVWMLPTNWKYGGWPSSGEVDIVEAVNLRRGDFPGWGNMVHGTLHYGLEWPQWENRGRPFFMFENPADDFHVYALEWEEDEIRWFVDGRHYQTQTSEGWYNYIWGGQERGFVVANERAPFDQLFHILLNVAVGGDWPGSPDTDWDGDREMLVDYVRVYPCPGGSGRKGGTACGEDVNPAIPPMADIGTPGINDYLVYRDGVETLDFTGRIFGQPRSVANTPVHTTFASPGATVSSDIDAGGVWEIEFARRGPLRWGEYIARVSLRSGDMSSEDGIDSGFDFHGGTGWTNNGEIEFEMKVDSIAPETKLFVKMESGEAGAGRVPIKVSADGNWHHVAVKLSDLLRNRTEGDAPLDPSDIQSLFVLESTGPARLALDDIRVQCAFNTQPEPWQTDKTCDLRPVAAGWIPVPAASTVDPVETQVDGAATPLRQNLVKQNRPNKRGRSQKSLPNE